MKDCLLHREAAKPLRASDQGPILAPSLARVTPVLTREGCFCHSCARAQEELLTLPGGQFRAATAHLEKVHEDRQGYARELLTAPLMCFPSISELLKTNLPI